MVTLGGVVSQFLCLFSLLVADDRKLIIFSAFFYLNICQNLIFKDLSMTVSVSIVLEEFFVAVGLCIVMITVTNIGP